MLFSFFYFKFYYYLFFMNPNPNREIEILKKEKLELENTLSRVRADYKALERFHKSTNDKVHELENEIHGNEEAIANLMNTVLALQAQISNLLNKNLSFVQLVNENLSYLNNTPVPVELVLSGAVAYKAYGRYSKKSKEFDSNTNSTPTFSLTPTAEPNIETLAPQPDVKSYQKIVEISARPLIKEIPIPTHGMWFPF